MLKTSMTWRRRFAFASQKFDRTSVKRRRRDQLDIS